MRIIKAQKVVTRGKVRFRVIVPKSEENPKPKQRWFRSRDGAEAFAREVNEGRSGQIRELAGLNLHERLLIAQSIKKAGSAQGVFDCVLMHAAALKLQQKPLAKVARECVNSKVSAGCRRAYLAPFELMLDRFSKHCGQDTVMSAITLGQVESFVSAPKVKVCGKNRIPDGPPSAWTRRSRTIDLRTLFSFAVTRGYCGENLAEKLQPIRIDRKVPEIYRPSEIADGLREVYKKYPRLIRYAALRIFGGLRPSEAQQNALADDTGDFIAVAPDASKTRSRRLVTVHPTLRAWLKLGGDSPLTEGRARKIRECFAVWKKNGLRHSFVSYSYALHGAKQTAIEAGHSEDVLHTHYREIVTRKAAEEFWSLTPIAVGI